MVQFAIQGADDTYKFKNSDVVVKYMFAAEQVGSGLSLGIIDRIFTGKNSEGISYQNKFNEDYDHDKAVAKIESWLKEDGVNSSSIKEIRKIVDYPETSDKMSQNRDIIEHQLKVKGIPTMIIDGKKETGLWKNT